MKTSAELVDMERDALLAEIKELRRVQSWLRSNLCEKHHDICTMSSGPCVMCRTDEQAPSRDSLRRAEYILDHYSRSHNDKLCLAKALDKHDKQIAGMAL